MKKFIALAIFAIGMLVMWPPGEQVKAANSDQVSFVIDHQLNVPAAAMLQDNYTFDQIGNVKYQNVINCREGGDVEVQVVNLATQPTYLIKMEVKPIDFNQYCNKGFRLCRDNSIDMNNSGMTIKDDNIFAHRFARDGLTQV